MRVGGGAQLTEKDWERLRMPEKDWVARQRDYGTTRLRDDETTRRRDHGTTGPRDDGTTGRRDCETTRQRDHEATRLRDDGTTRLRDCETTRPRDYTSAKNAGIARNIPKSRSLEVPKSPEKHSHSQAFSVVLSRSQPFSVVLSHPQLRGATCIIAPQMSPYHKKLKIFSYICTLYIRI